MAMAMIETDFEAELEALVVSMMKTTTTTTQEDLWVTSCAVTVFVLL